MSQIVELELDADSAEARMKAKQVIYPFAAIVGQEVLKRALILNIVNPNIGGVLIRGDNIVHIDGSLSLEEIADLIETKTLALLSPLIQ